MVIAAARRFEAVEIGLPLDKTGDVRGLWRCRFVITEALVCCRETEMLHGSSGATVIWWWLLRRGWKVGEGRHWFVTGANTRAGAGLFQR